MQWYLIMSLYALLAVQGHCSAQADVAVDKVLVKKSQRLLYLLKEGKIYRHYRISLGTTPDGHKQRMGDGRTPEGHYLIDHRNPHSQFYRSLHINYPNANDKQRAKHEGVNPGGQIFIHGSPNGLAVKASWNSGEDWTLGCIAVSNQAMDELWQLVKNGTPIEILP
jgi:murein L,D-transpeptidase YafK